MTPTSDVERARDLGRGQQLEIVTLGWNVLGVIVLAFAALEANSVALAGFGLDSLLEIGASTVVLWELADRFHTRRGRALRLIGWSFLALGAYLVIQSTFALALGVRPHHSAFGIAWTAATAILMATLARGKSRIGARLASPVLRAEGRVTLIDAILATAVLVGLVANAWANWWWADPATGYVIVYYALREARELLRT